MSIDYPVAFAFSLAREAVELSRPWATCLLHGLGDPQQVALGEVEPGSLDVEGDAVRLPRQLRDVSVGFQPARS